MVIEVQKGLHAEALRFISIPISHTIELTIDDFEGGGQYHPLSIKVPSPEAYIFYKGLVFERRINKQKKAKDLYYNMESLNIQFREQCNQQSKKKVEKQ